MIVIIIVNIRARIFSPNQHLRNQKPFSVFLGGDEQKFVGNCPRACKVQANGHFEPSAALLGRALGRVLALLGFWVDPGFSVVIVGRPGFAQPLILQSTRFCTFDHALYFSRALAYNLSRAATEKI